MPVGLRSPFVAPEQDAARLERLRRLLYRPGATDADRAAYLALRDVRAPVVPEGPRASGGRGDEPSCHAAPVRCPATPTRGTGCLAGRVALLVGVFGVVGAVALAALTSVSPSLTLARGRSIRLEALYEARPPVGIATLPQVAGSAETARYFSHTPAPLLERTTFARKQFFGSGRGATDFSLRGFDVGASSLSITVATDRPGPVEMDLATEDARKQLGRAMIARGTAAAAIPIAGWTPLRGTDDPAVLRVVVPPNTRFVVRAVFLEAEDRGTIR